MNCGDHLSAEAAFNTLDILRHNPRQDEYAAALIRGRWPVARKTGTSWGFRDAWSAGVLGNYVLAMLIGDFFGQRESEFVGVDVAAPLFFSIADALNLARASEPVENLVCRREWRRLRCAPPAATCPTPCVGRPC